MNVDLRSLGRQLLLAIWRGMLIAAVPYFLYVFADLFISRGDLPVLQRGPHVWLFYWPTVFWSHGHNLTDKDVIATLIINLFCYSAMAYAITRLRKKDPGMIRPKRSQ